MHEIIRKLKTIIKKTNPDYASFQEAKKIIIFACNRKKCRKTTKLITEDPPPPPPHQVHITPRRRRHITSDRCIQIFIYGAVSHVTRRKITDDFSNRRPKLDFVADDLYDGGLHELRRLVEAALYGRGHDLVQEVVHNSLTEKRIVFIYIHYKDG
jgi:hypothetical protein